MGRLDHDHDGEVMMEIGICSVFANDQENAIRVYTELLGFVRKSDIPATMFLVDDLKTEYELLNERGVVFTTPPTETEQMTFAVIDDTCGNLIQLVER
jgi:predicted enzyme related to lactoylglutathione lyase